MIRTSSIEWLSRRKTYTLELEKISLEKTLEYDLTDKEKEALCFHLSEVDYVLMKYCKD
tara:strand:- start:361 stop:537 length:177 start_codon:yes stop_codon:yes gene_type:complete